MADNNTLVRLWRNQSTCILLVGMWNGLWKSTLAVSQKVKHKVTYMTQQFYSEIHTQENWKHVSVQKLVQSSTMHNIQKVETTQMSIRWWMGRQNRVYLYNGILFSHEKEVSTVTRCNVEEPGKHAPKEAGYETPCIKYLYFCEIADQANS